MRKSPSSRRENGDGQNRYIYIYYMNTNEIPGELSRENMISSHMKITCYISPLLWLHNKSRLSQDKTVSVKWFGISLVFI